MIRIAFSENEIKRLAHERYHHPDARVRQRMDILYLKAMGWPHGDICDTSRVTKATLVKYLRAYVEGGIEQLKVFNYRRPVSALDQHAELLKSHFEKHPPHTVAEAIADIERLTGLQRKRTQVREWMKRIGMKVRKAGLYPGKPSDEGEKALEQEVYLKEKLIPRLNEEKEGKRTLFL